MSESITVESRVAELLHQAERRCPRPDDPFQLLLALVREISQSAGCQGLTVWDLRSGAATELLSLGTGERALLAPEISRLMSAAPDSKADVEDSAAAQARDADRVSRSSAGTTSGDASAAADVVTGVQVLLVIGARQPVDTEWLQMLADVMADLYRRELLQRLLQTSDRYAQILQLLRQMNSTLERDRVLNILATDGAAVLKADRIAVASRSPTNRWQLVAATGVTNPESRSDAVQALCHLIQQTAEAAATGSGLSSEQSDVGPARDSADQRSDSATNTTQVWPLSADGKWSTATVAAVIEFGHEPTATEQQTAELLLQHTAVTLDNCQRLQQSRPAVRARAALHRLLTARSLAAWLLVSGVLLWLLLGTATIRIEASGEAMPLQRQNVFAPEGGVITEVAVQDQQQVSAGQLLCRLRNDELAILKERLQGELAAATTRLAALETISGSAPSRVSDSGLPVSAEKEELKQRIRGLQNQTAIVDLRVNQLHVTAPLQGTVLKERIQETLTGRPVQQGQLLLQIADENGPWELFVRIPERDIRHVLAAQAAAAQPLAVSFVLDSAPQDVHLTQLTWLAESTDLDAGGQLSTLARAAVPVEVAAGMRPGAGVLARIECGQAAAGYVYFRQVIEFLERRLWL